jgi:hypothetical protein
VENVMLYRPRNVAALQVALGRLPGRMRVEIEADVPIRADCVDDLRRLPAWPENLALAVPGLPTPDGVVRVENLHHASRTSPKA